MSKKAAFIFFLMGLFLWGLVGFMISMTCFEPIIALEKLSTNKEAVKQVVSAWEIVFFKTTILWSVTGGILGIITMILFITKPERLLYTRLPVISVLPVPGPKTPAEMYTSFQSVSLGVLFSSIELIFILPKFQNDLVVLKTMGTVLAIGIILSLLMTVLILPFALNVMAHNFRSS